MHTGLIMKLSKPHFSLCDRTGSKMSATVKQTKIQLSEQVFKPKSGQAYS